MEYISAGRTRLRRTDLCLMNGDQILGCSTNDQTALRPMESLSGTVGADGAFGVSIKNNNPNSIYPDADFQLHSAYHDLPYPVAESSILFPPMRRVPWQ